MRKTIRLANAVAIVGALVACAQPPSKGPVKNITPLQAIETNSAGDEVRWGGPILSIAPKQEETCFRMLTTFWGPTESRTCRISHKGISSRARRATTILQCMHPDAL